MKFTPDCLLEAIFEQVHSIRNQTNPAMLRRQAALYMIKRPDIFYRKVMQTLLDDNESYQSYVINIFKGIRWGEPVIAAALSHMWNIPITIVTPTKHRVVKLFHKSEEAQIVIIANGYPHSCMKLTHYSQTQPKVYIPEQVPGAKTCYQDIVTKIYNNPHDARKDAISWGLNKGQEFLLRQYHETSLALQMVKGEVDKMTKRMQELNVMQEQIAFDLKTLGLNVEDSKTAVKKTLPSQETQTEPIQLQEQEIAVASIPESHQLQLQEQETAVTSISESYQLQEQRTAASSLAKIVGEPLDSSSQQFVLPPPLQEFVEQHSKPRTQYDTGEYVLMIDSTEGGEKVITVQEKTVSQNVQLAMLSGQEVSKILGEQPPTMISTETTPQVTQAVSSVPGPKSPLPELPTEIDISTSQETAQAMDILHKIPEEAFIRKNPKRPTRASATISKPPSDKQDVIDLAKGKEDDNDDDDHKQSKFDRSQGKPIPLAKQNPKRFYCDKCPRSYTRSGDLKIHQVEMCGKERVYNHICTTCQAKFVRKISMLEHIAEQHTKIPPYECEVCHMKFFKGPSFSFHKKGAHPGHTFPKHKWDK